MINQELISILTTASSGFAVLMLIAWGLALKLNFLSLVDAVWALGIGLGASAIAIQYGQNSHRILFILFLSLFWSLRLSFYLINRLKHHFPREDTRYLKMHESWKSGFLWKSLLFFLFQAGTQCVFVYPFISLSLDSEIFPHSFEIAGAILSLLGVLGEALSDSQLKRFKSDPAHRGQVCNVGLWKYSRHPNYFFEWIIWCGFGVAALGSPFGICALFCPALMLFLLLFVTGVKPSEEQSLRSRGDLYRNYQKTTSTFIPWFPKK